MLKGILSACILLITCYHANAQGRKNISQDIPVSITNITKDEIGKLPNFSADLLASYPFGKTGENLSLGVTARVTYTNNSYGFIRLPRMDSSDQRSPGVDNIPSSAVENIQVIEKRFGWIAGASYTYLPGKKEDLGSITYKYDPLSIVHAYGGVDYDPCPGGSLELGVGPAMGFFGGGNSEFGFGATANGFWAFTSSPQLFAKIRREKRSLSVFGVSGGLSLYKFGEADPLYTVNLGVRMTF